MNLSSIKKKYSKSKCPNCGKYCISYWEKINLMDFRYSNNCPECGGTIKLPAWHSLIYVCELILIIFLIVKFNLSDWRGIACGLFIIFFIIFIQLPLIPIKG